MTETTIQADAARVAAVNALRDMVAFLDARPEIPVPSEITVYIQREFHAGDRAMALAARRMGAALRIAPDGTTSAVKAFGPIRLRVAHLKSDHTPVAAGRPS